MTRVAAWVTALLASTPVQGQVPEIDLPPKGFGTLRQSDVAILVSTDEVRISILPLDERIIRLLAVDSYEALNSIRTDRADEIGTSLPSHGIAGTSAMLVTVFAVTNYARFDPEQIRITNRNQFFRPLAILPTSPRWSEHQLSRGQTSSAVYVFTGDLDPTLPMIVDYGITRVATWEQTLHRLEVERARVEARARIRSPHHP